MSAGVRARQKPDQRGSRADLHLLHDTTAVDLDGLLGRTELGSDLLVQHSGRDQLEYLALARSETREAAHEILALAMLRAPKCIPQQRLAYCGDELRALHRLRQKGDRTG